jgi:peroxiredoxin
MHSIWHIVSKLGCGQMAFQPSYFHKCQFDPDKTIDSIISQRSEKIGDEEYDVIEVSLMDHQRSRYYWLSRRDHLPRRVKEVVRVSEMLVNEENWMNVAVNQDMSDSLFAWKPPDGWVEYVAPSLESGLLPAGTLAPDFSFKTLDDKEFRLSDQRGKVVLINFWRVGCPPCRDELPWLEKMHQAHKNSGLVVVGYNMCDDVKYVRGLLDSNNVTYPNILNISEGAQQICFEEYQQRGMSAVPLNYLIDRQGKVIKAWYGCGENLDLTIKRIVEEE